LIAFGCPRVVLKLNLNGFGEIFDLEKFRKERGEGKEGWDEQLVEFAKLSE
jgi:hypothetical protein